MKKSTEKRPEPEPARIVHVPKHYPDCARAHCLCPTVAVRVRDTDR